MSRRIASALLPAALGVAMLAGCATAPAPGCRAADLPPEALVGTWQADFAATADTPADTAQVVLRPHPDYAGVQGEVTRQGRRAQLAGDLNDAGVLALDESDDGRRISAVWVGELQGTPDACGRTLRGSWRRAADEQTQPFVLTKISASR